MTRRRKICFALPSLAGGGAERAAVQILNALDGSRWERSLYLFRREGPYLSDVASSIEIHAADSDARLGRWRALCRHVQSGRPDLVVSFLSYFTVLSAVRAAHTGARVVFNQQTPMSAFLGDRDYPWRRPWNRILFRMATRLGYRAADLVVTTSRGVAEDLVASFGVPEQRLRVVHNPIDLGSIDAAREASIDPQHASRWEHPVIVTAGRLAEAKNIPLLIEAFALLRRRMSARLFVLGQGDREPALRDLVSAKQLNDAVTFCGFQSNPWKYMARADVFALTSRYEGFGNVLVEAMACGVPVVATSSPGTREIIRAGDTGLLVERHEAEAVAGALEQVLADRGLRDRMAAAARREAERFSTPAIAAEYDQVFSEAVA